MTRVRIYCDAGCLDWRQTWAGWWDGDGFLPTTPDLTPQQDRNIRWHMRDGRPTARIDEDVLYTADPYPTARELLGLPDGELTRDDIRTGLSLAMRRHEAAAAELLALMPPDKLRANDLLDAAFD